MKAKSFFSAAIVVLLSTSACFAAASSAIVLPPKPSKKFDIHVEGRPYAPEIVDGQLCFTVKWFSFLGNVGKDTFFRPIVTWNLSNGKTVTWFDDSPDEQGLEEELIGAVFDKNGCQIIDSSNSMRMKRSLVE